MNTCTHAPRYDASQFYNISNKVYFPHTFSPDLFGYWIWFQTGNYQIRHAGFYRAQFRLPGNDYTCLLIVFNTTPLYLPFVKVIHVFTMRKLDDYVFVNNNALRDDRDIQSTIKQKATKIDSVDITFHPNDNSKVICIQPFLENFKVTTEGADAQTYSDRGIVIKIWNDSIEYQILLDAFKFSNNSIGDYLEN
jgi:hypothetical protein